MDWTDVIGRPRDWTRNLTVATAAGVFLGAIGPFGSYLSANAGVRIAYWTGMFWVGALFLAPAIRAASRLGPRLGFPLWFAVAAATLLASAPLAAAAALVSDRLWPRHVQAMGPVDWYLETLLLAAPIAAGLMWFERAGLRAAAPALQAALSGQSLLSRLPGKLGRDLICLEVEDHYVRAHTAEGSALILITLQQAMAELDGIEGQQVHRSWWVAKSALVRSVADGRNVRLILSNGTQAPVARNRVAELRALGWI